MKDFERIIAELGELRRAEQYSAHDQFILKPRPEPECDHQYPFCDQGVNISFQKQWADYQPTPGQCRITCKRCRASRVCPISQWRSDRSHNK